MPVTRLAESRVRWRDEPDTIGQPEGGEIHLWRFDLDAPDGVVSVGLSPEETERARRFRFDRDGRRYARGRQLLRLLIGRYVGVAPGELVFDYNDNGKPCIGGELAGCDLAFNLSHSGSRAVCAIAMSADVGVDVELTTRSLDVVALAERHFYPAEAHLLASLEEHEREQMFYRYWTCKEAHVKALGLGLGSGAQLVDCSVLDAEGQYALEGSDIPAELRWIPFAEGDDLIGAVVVSASVRRVSAWTLQP